MVPGRTRSAGGARDHPPHAPAAQPRDRLPVAHVPAQAALQVAEPAPHPASAAIRAALRRDRPARARLRPPLPGFDRGGGGRGGARRRDRPRRVGEHGIRGPLGGGARFGPRHPRRTAGGGPGGRGDVRRAGARAAVADAGRGGRADGAGGGVADASGDAAGGGHPTRRTRPRRAGGADAGGGAHLRLPAHGVGGWGGAAAGWGVAAAGERGGRCGRGGRGRGGERGRGRGGAAHGRRGARPLGGAPRQHGRGPGRRAAGVARCGRASRGDDSGGRAAARDGDGRVRGPRAAGGPEPRAPLDPLRRARHRRRVPPCGGAGRRAARAHPRGEPGRRGSEPLPRAGARDRRCAAHRGLAGARLPHRRRGAVVDRLRGPERRRSRRRGAGRRAPRLGRHRRRPAHRARAGHAHGPLVRRRAGPARCGAWTARRCRRGPPPLLAGLRPPGVRAVLGPAQRRLLRGALRPLLAARTGGGHVGAGSLRQRGARAARTRRRRGPGARVGLDPRPLLERPRAAARLPPLRAPARPARDRLPRARALDRGRRRARAGIAGERRRPDRGRGGVGAHRSGGRPPPAGDRRRPGVDRVPGDGILWHRGRGVRGGRGAGGDGGGQPSDRRI